MDHAEAIQTGVVYFQPYHCLYLSIAYSYLRKEWNTDVKNELSNTCQKSPICSFFIFICSWRHVHQTQVWVVLKKVWKLLILAIRA